MEKETAMVVEWRIVHLGHWCSEVHSEGIRSPKVLHVCDRLELYPRGVSGQDDEHLLVRFVGIERKLSGELSIIGPDGSCIFKQRVTSEGRSVLDIPMEGTLDEVFERVGAEDLLTVRCRVKNDRSSYRMLMCTDVSALDLSLKVSSRWIERRESEGLNFVAFVPCSRSDENEGMELYTWCEDGVIQFMMEAMNKKQNAISVDIALSFLSANGTLERRENHRKVFKDQEKVWAFPDSLKIKDIVDRGVTMQLDFKVKTTDWIESHVDLFYAETRTSVVPNSNACFFDRKTFGRAVPSDETSAAVLKKELTSLYQDKEYSDFQLKCGNVTFPVHRNILSARSPVFKTMLSSDMLEAASGTVDIGDLDPSTLGLFLTYLYTGTVDDLQNQSDSAPKLFYAADKYQVHSLKRECAHFLCANVSISNVCDILSLAERHQDDRLASAAHNFILRDFNEVMRSKEWESFVYNEPLLAAKTVTHFAASDRVRTCDPK